jgi:hypothetical protein
MSSTAGQRIAAKIQAFGDAVALPALHEIESTLSRDGKQPLIYPGGFIGIPLFDSILGQIPGGPMAVTELPTLPDSWKQADVAALPYIGYSLVVEVPIPGTARTVIDLATAEVGYEATVSFDTYETKYFQTIKFAIEGAEVCACPVVIYFMRFNNRLHMFQHRFDAAIEKHRVDDITREHILNHFLGSFFYYQTSAQSASRPAHGLD